MSSAYFAGAIIGALFMGILCGLLPLIVGLVKGQQNLAVIGLLACIGGGLVAGILLALPIAIVFTVVIINKASKATGLGA